MISASSRDFVLNGETTTWRTKLKKAIIKADYLIVSVRPVDGVFGMDSYTDDQQHACRRYQQQHLLRARSAPLPTCRRTHTGAARRQKSQSAAPQSLARNGQ
jgi:hypothetical protein